MALFPLVSCIDERLTRQDHRLHSDLRTPANGSPPWPEWARSRSASIGRVPLDRRRICSPHEPSALIIWITAQDDSGLSVPDDVCHLVGERPVMIVHNSSITFIEHCHGAGCWFAADWAIGSYSVVIRRSLVGPLVRLIDRVNTPALRRVLPWLALAAIVAIALVIRQPER